jgi:hypothetical protein
VVGLLIIFMIFMSGVAAGLWTLYKDDFQGAFGFAGWIMGVAGISLSVFLAKCNSASQL